MFYNVKQHAQKMNLEYKIMWNLVQSHLKCQKIKLTLKSEPTMTISFKT